MEDSQLMQNKTPTKKSIGYDVKITLLLFTILLVSPMVGQNLIQVFGYTISASIFIFPFTFILVAAATELFGFKYARSMIWMSAFCGVLMIGIILLFIQLPAYRAYLGEITVYHKFCLRLTYLMSITIFAYIVSEYMNAWIIAKLRILIKGKFLLPRALLSISAASIINVWIIFPFVIPPHGTLSDAAMEAAIDMVIILGYEVALLPLVWLIVAYVKYQAKTFGIAQAVGDSPYSSVIYLKENAIGVNE